jgi:hypothetical protein
MIQAKAFFPWAAAEFMDGIANTTDESITQPNIPDTSTDRTIPRGTCCAAPTVSSAVWAEASKPVTV